MRGLRWSLPVMLFCLGCADRSHDEQAAPNVTDQAAPTAASDGKHTPKVKGDATGALGEAEAPTDTPRRNTGRANDALATPALPPSPTAGAAPGAPDGASNVELAAVAEGEDAGRTRDEIQSALAPQTTELQKCLSNSDVRVRLEAQVDPSGTLSAAKVARAEPSDPTVNQCIASTFGKLVLPKASNGQSSKIAIDLTLRRTVAY